MSRHALLPQVNALIDRYKAGQYVSEDDLEWAFRQPSLPAVNCCTMLSMCLPTVLRCCRVHF
jgi:hypothetical protein